MTAVPTIKDYYGDFYHRQLENARPAKAPKRVQVDVEKTLRLSGAGLTLERIQTAVEAFATAQGVSASDVRIAESWDGVMLCVRRLQTDAEYDKVLKFVERKNKAIEDYRRDVKAVRDFERAEQRKSAQEDARIEALAQQELVREAKDRLRTDAKVMGTILETALADEDFVKSLRKTFAAAQKA